MAEYTGRQLAKRYVLLVTGLFIMACGIAMSKRAELGTTPISCIPAVLSYTSLTIGTWTVIFNTLMVLAQVLLLRREFQRFQLLQIAVGFLIGAFTDIWMMLMDPFVNPAGYPAQWAFCVLSVVILGFGVMLEIRSNVLMAPGEGLVLALSRVTGVPFPRMKVVSDVSMVAVGVLLSLLLNGGLFGVREGTVFAAITVGFVVGFYRSRLGELIDRLLE